MHSRKNCTVSSRDVQQWAQNQIGEHLSIKDHGKKCTQDVLLKVLLLAAAGITSIGAICKKLSGAPTSQAILAALRATLPDLATLERQVNRSLWPDAKRLKALRRKPREIAIDLTLIPYHGQPHSDPSEIYRSQPKSGTTHFHAYATAYVIHKGHRYTLALTRVLADEAMSDVLGRLVKQVRSQGVRIKLLLLDRGFFSVKMVRSLRAMRCPFLMPVIMRGRKKKNPKAKPSGLRAFLKKRNGWYKYRMRGKDGRCVNLDICVASKKFLDKKTGKKKFKKLVYASWRMTMSPLDVRELYRKRFGIETSYRQMHQARIRTCTRDPLLRLLYVSVALILLNVWVWLHETFFTENGGLEPTRHLEKLRFREMLQWIEQVIERLLHDGSDYYVDTG